jgi:heat shock protein HtpX
MGIGRNAGGSFMNQASQSPWGGAGTGHQPGPWG